MCDRVIHKRSFESVTYNPERILEFDTAVDVFKVIHVDTVEGLPTVWYETLDNPVYRRKVVLQMCFDNERIPDNSTHVGSTVYRDQMVHVYQVMQTK